MITPSLAQHLQTATLPHLLGHKNAGIPHNNLAVGYVCGKRNETGEADENGNNRGQSRARDRRMFAKIDLSG